MAGDSYSTPVHTPRELDETFQEVEKTRVENNCLERNEFTPMEREERHRMKKLQALKSPTLKDTDVEVFRLPSQDSNAFPSY